MKKLKVKQFLFRLYYLVDGIAQYQTTDFRIRNVNPNKVLETITIDLLNRVRKENNLKAYFIRVYEESIYEVSETELIMDTDVVYESAMNKENK